MSGISSKTIAPNVTLVPEGPHDLTDTGRYPAGMAIGLAMLGIAGGAMLLGSALALSRLAWWAKS